MWHYRSGSHIEHQSQLHFKSFYLTLFSVIFRPNSCWLWIPLNNTNNIFSQKCCNNTGQILVGYALIIIIQFNFLLFMCRVNSYNTIQYNNNNNNNNSIQFFIIYAPSQQPQGQLQKQHSTDIHNYIMDTHNIKSRVNCRST
jgi:hypothetical protein